MKIAYDSQIFTLQQYGGISRYFVKLLKELHGQGVDAKAFACIYQNRYLNELPQEVVSGVSIKKYPPKTARGFKAVNHLVCNFAVSGYKPDVLHETYYSSLGAPYSGGAARFVTVYDMIHEKFPNDFSPTDKTTRNKFKAVDRAEHIICISESTKKDLCEIFGTDAKKVSVVYLGFDEIAIKPVSEVSSIEKPYFLYVGQRKGYKNFSTLLQSVACTSRLSANVDIVAFGGGHFTVAEQEMINRLGFKEGQVRQMSGGDQLLADAYSNALGFVYPSIYEGFGLPPLEAMAYRCPVISSNTSSMPEVIGDAGLYFDPHSVEELATRLISILENDSLREELIASGIKRKDQFTWRKCADETLALYRQYSKGSEPR